MMRWGLTSLLMVTLLSACQRSGKGARPSIRPLSPPQISEASPPAGPEIPQAPARKNLASAYWFYGHPLVKQIELDTGLSLRFDPAWNTGTTEEEIETSLRVLQESSEVFQKFHAFEPSERPDDRVLTIEYRDVPSFFSTNTLRLNPKLDAKSQKQILEALLELRLQVSELYFVQNVWLKDLSIATVADVPIARETVQQARQLAEKHKCLRAIGLGKQTRWLRLLDSGCYADISEPLTAPYAKELSRRLEHRCRLWQAIQDNPRAREMIASVNFSDEPLTHESPDDDLVAAAEASLTPLSELSELSIQIRFDGSGQKFSWGYDSSRLEFTLSPGSDPESVFELVSVMKEVKPVLHDLRIPEFKKSTYHDVSIWKVRPLFEMLHALRKQIEWVQIDRIQIGDEPTHSGYDCTQTFRTMGGSANFCTLTLDVGVTPEQIRSWFYEKTGEKKLSVTHRISLP